MRRSSVAATLFLCCVAGCAHVPPLPGWEAIPVPDAGDVESVVYFLGDAGDALPGRSPILRALQQDVEHWSGQLRQDSAVVVVFLGDNVYPAGLHDRGTPSFPQDSAHLAAQIDVLSGPAARRRGARAYFVAGNHDWGKLLGQSGVQRLENEDSLLTLASLHGPTVRLMPEAGSPGPAQVDVGSHVRLLFLDTAWWLYEQDTPGKDSLMYGVEHALRTAGRRQVILASHHPYMSSGSHGGLVPFWQTLGLEYLLYKSGSLLQDLNSEPYKELLRRLRQTFASVRRPLLYVGGHDHSLQAFVGPGPGDPYYALVSGAASKSTKIGSAPNMRFKAAQPGFMRLMVRRDGHMDLFVFGVPATYLMCPPATGAPATGCVDEGAKHLTLLYSARLI